MKIISTTIYTMYKGYLDLEVESKSVKTKLLESNT
jgi:hypothetical protein